MTGRDRHLDDFYTAHAGAYDTLTRGVEGDVDYYVARYLEVDGPAVEVGVGTGRIAVPALEAGAELIGVDLSAEMLAICRQKAAAAGVADRLTTIEAPMQAFTVPSAVDLVTIPFRTFLHNLTSADQRATLAACRRALRPGGRLIVNMFNPNLATIAYWIGRGDVDAGPAEADRAEAEAAAASAGTDEERYYGTASQVVTTRVPFRDAEGRRQRYEINLRWVYRYEMEHLLALEGFEVESLHGDFADTPFDDLSPEMVWTARRRG